MAVNVNAIEVLARKAGNQDGFIGAVLNAIAMANETTVADIVSSIGCSTENMPRLVLCKIPRTETEYFSTDVRQISDFADCDADLLANLVREYQAIAAMRRYDPSDSPHETMLMAARDKKREYDEDSGDGE